MFFRPSQLTARPAARTDYDAIQRLLADSWAVHSRLHTLNIKNRLETNIAYIVEDQVALRGFVMVEPQPPETGLIVSLALHNNFKISTFLDVVLPAIEKELIKHHIKRLVQIGEAAWLTQELARCGFEVRNQVITLQWIEQPFPNIAPHPQLQIRSARITDLADLLFLDQLVFGPLWHKPRQTFREALAQAVSFAVGYIDDTVVAYEWCDQLEDHGHITRLATLPSYQGQGIGAFMLRYAIEALTKRGVETISLNTQKDNLRSQQLYYRFGFKPTGYAVDVFQKTILK